MAPTVQDIRVFVETPKPLKPILPWEELLNNLIIPTDLPKIQSSKGVIECHPEKLLKAVGAAICDDRLARGANIPEEIFLPENKFKVVSTVNRVLIKLRTLNKSVIHSEEVHEIVENCLLDEGETLAAKGYLLFRTQKQRRSQTSKKLEVIRRNGKKAAWNPEKIFNAIYKAFLSSYLEDSREASEQEKQECHEKATRVTEKVVHEITGSGREVVHIEEIQDIVERILREMGYQEIAKRYAAYRVENMLKKKFLRLFLSL